MGYVIVMKMDIARLKAMRSRRPEGGDMGAKTDGGVDVKINGAVIGCEDGVKWENTTLLDGRD